MSAPITTQPTKTPEPHAVQKNEWTTGTFNCFDDILGCLCVICLPCCYMGSQAEKMGEHYCFGCCFPPLAHMMLRVKLRERHQLRGSMCKDVCCAICCEPCMACQLGRELNNLGYEKKCSV